MNVRNALTALALVLPILVTVAPRGARADLPPPPVVLTIAGQAGTLTAALPDRVEFVLENRDQDPMSVYLFRVVVLDGATRIPLEISATEVDGAAAGRTVRVPPGGRVRIAVRFTTPANMHGRASYSFDLSVRMEGTFGTYNSTPAVITRAPRRT